MQELVEGKSLGQMVEAGWQPEQQEVDRIAKELLSTFSYLQDQKVQISCAALGGGLYVAVGDAYCSFLVAHIVHTK